MNINWEHILKAYLVGAWPGFIIYCMAICFIQYFFPAFLAALIATHGPFLSGLLLSIVVIPPIAIAVGLCKQKSRKS